MPGLASSGRVRDYRRYRVSQTGNFETYLNSPMIAAEVLEAGCSLVWPLQPGQHGAGTAWAVAAMCLCSWRRQSRYSHRTT